MSAAVVRSSWRTRLRHLVAALWQPQLSSAARERRDVLALLIAVACVMAPHFSHIPPWMSAVIALLWVWRLWLNLAQRPLPSRWLLLPLLAAAAFGVWLQYRTLLGRDAGVAFLLSLLALKLLEMRAKRDVFVVIFLCFFVLLTQFMWDQELPVALATIATVVLLFFVLVGVHMTDVDLSTGSKFKLVGGMLLKALPLTVTLFLLFPRLASPLWGVPGGQSSATGLSNTMSPGAISELIESHAVAFRVRFDGTPPRNEALYWRGPVFGFFTGWNWTPLTPAVPPAPWRAEVERNSEVRYTVTLEPHQRDWLFALEVPGGLPEGGDLSVRMTADGQMLAGRLVQQRVRYEMRSYTRHRVGTDTSVASLQDYLRLPRGYNPRSLEFATELRQRAGDAPPQRRVQAVLDHFRRGGFRYTLKPRALGRHSVDEFLFDTREGFCEHYAAAFVVLMRALEVPARVVTGYQGGEVNPVDGYMTVRQSDAHAWAEVWLAGRGWTRVDPTAVVAPVRIEVGAPEIAAAAGIDPLFGGRGSGLPLLGELRFRWEALQNSWNQWVLTYSDERQRAFLEFLGFHPDLRTLGLLFATALTVILALLTVVSLRHRTVRDPLAAAYGDLRERLRGAGANVPDHLGPRALAARFGTALTATSNSQLRALAARFEELRYSRASVATTRRQIAQLRRAVARYRPEFVGAELVGPELAA
jgi:transglutaminase-like putative cysteine protease